MPLLAKHGLSFTALPTYTEQGALLVGRLLHTSGDSLEGSLPIHGRAMQEIGSSLTYARRYLLGCITGLVTDDDDDGQAATTAAKRAQPKRPAVPPAERQASASAPAEGGNGVTAAQLAKLGASMGDLGITDRDLRLQYVADVIGRPVESSKQLSKAEASKVIEALAAELDAQAGAGQ